MARASRAAEATIETRQPVDTTANPNWPYAEKAIDLVPQLHRDDETADLFVKYCGNFTLTQGAMAGRRLSECWLPWQKAALRSAFQVRETMLLTAKGSGKSTMIASFAIAYVMLSAKLGINHRGLVAILAPSIPAARIIFDHASQGILADDDLRPQFRTNVQNRSITHEFSGITIQILPVDMSAAVGRRPVLMIVDDLFEVAKIRDSIPVLNQLRQGGRNWGKNFKVINISTMSTSKPEGEFARVLDYARKVRDGQIDDENFLPLLFEFPIKERPDLDPLDPAQWWRGAPSLTTAHQSGTMDSDELQLELETAKKAEDAEQFGLVLSQRLGIEASSMIDGVENVIAHRWPDLPRDIKPKANANLAIAIDVGGIDDPCAMAVMWKEPNHRRVYIEVDQYITRTGYDRANSSLRLVYDQAKANGTLEILETTDEIDDLIARRCRHFYDSSGMANLIIGGDEHGRTGFKTVFQQTTSLEFHSVPQNFLLGSALSTLEGWVIDGIVNVRPCPLLTDNARNLKVEEGANGARRLRKGDAAAVGRGRYAKIDGIVAVLNGVHLLNIGEEKLFFDVSAWIA